MKELLPSGRPARVLLIEDNNNDVELTRIAFKRTSFAVNLHHVSNGEECMMFLRKEGSYANAPTPDLILLDLNLPRVSGHEVLNAIARDERLKHLPVVILTTSDAEGDVLLAYQLRCSSYIVKPLDFEKFSKMVQGLADYWFKLVVLPSNTRSRSVD